MPSASPSPPPSPDNRSSAVPLADVLGTHRSLTSFSALARTHPSPRAAAALSKPGSDDATAADATVIVFAPHNLAVEALPRKPWEDPGDYAALGQAAYDGAQGRDGADRNLARFVDRHLVGVDAWPPRQRAASLAGRELWWDRDAGGGRVVLPDRIDVERVASRIARGEVVSLPRHPLPWPPGLTFSMDPQGRAAARRRPWHR